MAWCSSNEVLRRSLANVTDPRVVLAPYTAGLPRQLRGRLGLAAGMDKNARAVVAFHALGFGFVEIGTVTPLPQPGNDKPRLWRLPQTREVRNRMGFNNDGVEAVRDRLHQLRSTVAGRACVVGANIGKNKLTDAADAPSDYYKCARSLAALVDFLVINVSSPNTPGLRDLQSVESLDAIVDATVRGAAEGLKSWPHHHSRRHQRQQVPVLVKIAPDLDDRDMADIADLINQRDLHGVVAANTTNRHEFAEGGVSGPRLLQRGCSMVHQLRSQLDPGRTIIGVGGISTVEDALAYRDAGADLLEALTGLIYGGITWPGRINRALGQW